MFKKKSIKSQIISSIAIILGIVIILQLLLYSFLQKENRRVVTTLFDSVVQNTVQQITKLNRDIAESSLLLAVHPEVQACLYEYTSYEIINNYSTTSNILSDYMKGNQNVAFWGIIKNRELFMSAEKKPFYDNIWSIIEDFPEQTNSSSVFLPSFVLEGETFFPCVTPIYPSKISYRTPEHAGNFIICIYKLDSIQYVPSGVFDNSLINLVITDSKNRVLLSNSLSEHGKDFSLTDKSERFLYQTISLDNPNWNVTAYMPSENLSAFSNLLLYFMLFMVLFTIAMLFLILKLVDVIIIKRINLLKTSAEKISENNADYRITYEYNDEFSPVIAVINEVLDKVHNLNNEKIKTLDSLYQAQLLQKETRIFYLYSQVSPHFLYNSLTHILGLVLKNETTKTVSLITSLSKVFRYFSNNQSVSNIKRDLDCAIEYFNVINTKRTIPINLINTVSPDIYCVPCLKMIYQPILENALKHAFDLDDTGTITISSIPHESKAIIEIKDDGMGISAESLKKIESEMAENDLTKIQNNEHVGLLNVHARLRLYYNSDCGLQIDSKDGEGTVVRIIFDKELPNEI